jgi:hypothetical protein
MNLKTWIYFFAKHMGFGVVKRRLLWGAMKLLLAITRSNEERIQCHAILLSSEVMYFQIALEKAYTGGGHTASITPYLGMEAVLHKLGATMKDLLDDNFDGKLQFSSPDKDDDEPKPFGTYGGSDL